MPGLILPYRGIIPEIAEDVFVASNATVIGDVVIGSQSSIWFGVVIRGDVHEIRIGERTNIQDGTIVHVTRGKFGCYIGSEVTIGHGVILHACHLEDRCFIGMGAIVMDGARVETGGMVAAGALVTPGKVVGKDELWAGSPAKYSRPLSEEDKNNFPRLVAGYVELGQEYRVVA